MRLLIAVVAVLGAVGSLPASAAAVPGALTQLTGAAGCIQNAGLAKDPTCALGRAFQETSAIVVSPDGKNAYSVSTNSPAGIESFRRDPATGALAQLPGVDGCTTVDGTDDTGTAGACRTGAGLSGSRFVVISHDGKSVYVASSNSSDVAIFNRSAATGVLTQPAGAGGCIATATGDPACATGARLLSDARDMALSPDDRFLYVSGADDSAVAVLARNTTTGSLSAISGALGCVNASGNDGSGAGTCTAARRLYEPTSIAITANGRFMYVTASEGAVNTEDGAVISFARDPATGAVTQLAGAAGCLNPSGDDGTGPGTCTTGKALHDANGVALSPDETSVYVAAQGDGSVVTPGALDVFSRNATTGALTQLAGTAGCISLDGSDGFNAPTGVCGIGRGLDEVSGVTVSRDGRTVYTASSDTDTATTPVGAAAVAVFSRAATGVLTQLAGTAGCVSDAAGTDSVGGTTCAPGHGVTGPNIIAISPDCSSLYAANQDTQSGVTSFSRESVCAAPVVALTAVSGITPTSATVAGTVNPLGYSTAARFDYGLTTAYGSSTPTTSVGSDSVVHAKSAAISGLTPATTYHVRIVAVNQWGTSVSPDQTFTTAPAPLVAKIVRVRATKTKVRVTISCKGPAGKSCTGSLKLTVRARLKPHGKLKTLTIGKAKAKVPAGKSRTVSIKISSRGRALRRKHTLKAKVTLRVPKATGQPKATSTKKVTLRKTH